MTELFLDALKFLLNVPESNATISRGSHELVSVTRMEFPVVNSVYMPFGLPELFYPHVPFHCQ